MDSLAVNLLSVEWGVFKPLPFILAVAAAVPAFFLSLRSLALLGQPRIRMFIICARAAALCLLVAVLVQPVLVVRKGEKRKSVLQVLVDASPSALGASGAFDSACAYIRGNRDAFNRLAAAYDLRFSLFSADTTLDSIAGFPLAVLTRYNGQTGLSDALALLRDPEPAGILLFSDGIFSDNFSSRRQLGLPLFDRSQYPVFACAPGKAAAEDMDIAIESVHADKFAYVKNPFTVQMSVVAKVPGPLSIPVRIKRGSEIIASKTIAIKKGEGRYQCLLEFAPEEVGHYTYTVSFPPYAFESNTANNRSEFALKVIRDRIRILHICGRPSWDAKFLRNTLKKDPAIDLVAFYILRTASDVMNVPEEELSLIVFPYQQLFGEELPTFDLVIFQNFSYRTFFSAAYTDNIRKFVEKGGSFLMIGGDLSFSEGGYQGTPLDPILPYALEASRQGTLVQGFHAHLTATGAHHPVTSLIEHLEDISFEGFNSLGAPREHTLTLLETDAQAPLCGVREVGKGRTMAIATDCLWYYDFINAGKKIGNRPYQEFVSRAVRWLIKDPALGALAIRGLRAEYGNGSSITCVVDLKERKPGQVCSVSLVNSSGKAVARQTIGSNKGSYPVEFKDLSEGIYIVRAELLKDRFVQDYATETFAISARNEFGAGGFDLDMLGALCSESNGVLMGYGEKNLRKTIAVPERQIARIVEKKNYPLWNTRLLVIAIVLLFSVEWFIRKRKGLL